MILSGTKQNRYAGVGAIVSPWLRPHLQDVLQVSPRLLRLTFGQQGGSFHIVGAYAPHAGLDFEEDRAPFWETLEAHLAKIPQPEPVFLTGDLSVRFQARHRKDQGLLGPFVYGKGTQAIDHSASSNRTLCLNLMKQENMVEVCSFRTPCLKQQITYRDKAAPPQDWSQFVLDPIALQQFYAKTSQIAGPQALDIAFKIRSFLDVPSLLAPPTIPPQVDPVRFQKLDHTLCRRQWLNSVKSCRSLLHCGFASDHYPLVTEISVKLAQRPKRNPNPKPFQVFAPTPEQTKAFQDALHGDSADTAPPPPPDHTAKHFFTDGSGSRGRCTATTPAGWGFCLRLHDSWEDVYGPVPTDPNHPRYCGAAVGSNNTGELTAILEAALYAHERSYRQVIIHSDSQWAINVLKGRWKAKKHKAMVNYIREVLRSIGQLHLQWVKAHVGQEGNERADKLANQGRQSAFAQGTTAPYPDHSASRSDNPDTLEERMFAAAKLVFPTQKLAPRKPWITENTLNKLAQARAASANGEDNAKTLLYQAKRSAKKNKVQWVHDQLLADPRADHSAVWKVVRNQKKGFQGRKSHLHVDGKPIPWSRTHVAFRDHYAQKQWHKSPNSDEHAAILRNRPPLRPTKPDQGDFKLEDLQEAIGKIKKGKAPGPDGLVGELFQMLDHTAEAELLQLYNDLRKNPKIPKSWLEARVVAIFKGKGADTDPANYRPISLLNMAYKILASMIQARLSRLCEDDLRTSQYGFRPHRGTSQPLFVLRRAMEWANMTQRPLNLLFLDWKQAFDSIDHSALIIALRRFGLPVAELELIEQFYNDASFELHAASGDKANGAFGSGIRQGCPLSPYLFIILLSVIFEDVEDLLLNKGVPTNVWSINHSCFDLEYADDTLLISLTIPQMQQILSSLEVEASLYGMFLNSTKTELLIDPRYGPQTLLFQDRSQVPTADSVKYLGSLVSWNKPFETAFYHRRALTIEAYKKLRLVWNSRLPKKAKLRIFLSVFLPTLLYGLDAFTLTTPQLKRLNGFYFGYLRRVIGIKAAYFSRITNHTVWYQAGYPRRPSDMLFKLERRCMNRVYQTAPHEPVYSVVFQEPFKDRIKLQGRRRGRQIAYWAETTAKRHFKEIFDHSASGHSIFGPHFKYALIARHLRVLEPAPMRAIPRAGP